MNVLKSLAALTLVFTFLAPVNYAEARKHKSAAHHSAKSHKKYKRAVSSAHKSKSHKKAKHSKKRRRHA